MQRPEVRGSALGHNSFLPTYSVSGSCSLSQVKMVCQAQGCAWFEGFFVLFLLLTLNVDGCGTVFIPSQRVPLGWRRRQERGRVLVPDTKGFAESWGCGVQESRAGD